MELRYRVVLAVIFLSILAATVWLSIYGSSPTPGD
jgi:hypothetical protein